MVVYGSSYGKNQQIYYSDTAGDHTVFAACLEEHLHLYISKYIIGV